jgi:hypothetical protein
LGLIISFDNERTGQMKTRAVVSASLAALTGTVILLSYALSGDRMPSGQDGSRVASAKKQGPAETSIKRPEAELQEREAATAAHIQYLKEQVDLRDAKTKAAIAAAKYAPETADTTGADAEAAALEKHLLDSLSSLTQQLIMDPSLTTSVIVLLSKETDPETMMMIAQALGEAAATMGDKFPYDLLLSMAENDADFKRRFAALTALGYMSNPSADLKQRMSELATGGSTADLRAMAVSTMGSWMGRNRELTQQISDELLAARDASDDPTVRGMVIQSIGNMDSPLTPRGLAAMTDAVLSEREATNRSLAAVALGSGSSPDNRAAVLAALESAYLAEPELDTQRHILTQITKAAGSEAELYLQRLPTPHPLLAQDVQDYVGILASVDRTNWSLIWDKKSDLDDKRGTYPLGSGGHSH